MKKYDCSKTQDCIHEYHRLCDSYPAGCESDCPFIGVEEICGFDIFENEDKIALLQKWSNEHPEAPTITKEERVFLEAFKIPDSKIIRRGSVGVFLYFGSTNIELWGNMFPFIKEGETWSIYDLLKLEVEE